MGDIKITVGGAIEADATRRFTDAWHRAERVDYDSIDTKFAI